MTAITRLNRGFFKTNQGVEVPGKNNVIHPSSVTRRQKDGPSLDRVIFIGIHADPVTAEGITPERRIRPWVQHLEYRRDEKWRCLTRDHTQNHEFWKVVPKGLGRHGIQRIGVFLQELPVQFFTAAPLQTLCVLPVRYRRSRPIGNNFWSGTPCKSLSNFLRQIVLIHPSILHVALVRHQAGRTRCPLYPPIETGTQDT